MRLIGKKGWHRRHRSCSLCCIICQSTLAAALPPSPLSPFSCSLVLYLSLYLPVALCIVLAWLFTFARCLIAALCCLCVGFAFAPSLFPLARILPNAIIGHVAFIDSRWSSRELAAPQWTQIALHLKYEQHQLRLIVCNLQHDAHFHVI